jgi:hypothetical protein
MNRHDNNIDRDNEIIFPCWFLYFLFSLVSVRLYRCFATFNFSLFSLIRLLLKSWREYLYCLYRFLQSSVIHGLSTFTNRWNEGFKDDILNDMMMNAQKFDDFLINITEHENSVDECVEQISILLADIFEQYTKTVSVRLYFCFATFNFSLFSLVRLLLKSSREYLYCLFRFLQSSVIHGLSTLVFETRDCVYSLIKKLSVKEFNTYSCHAPLAVELYMKGNRVIKDQCTCMKTVYDTNRWN